MIMCLCAFIMLFLSSFCLLVLYFGGLFVFIFSYIIIILIVGHSLRRENQGVDLGGLGSREEFEAGKLKSECIVRKKYFQ